MEATCATPVWSPRAELGDRRNPLITTGVNWIRLRAAAKQMSYVKVTIILLESNCKLAF